MFNPIIGGWFQYYGRFYRSGLYTLRWYLNSVLVRWATRKYKKLNHRFRRAEQWLRRVSHRDSQLFAHWQRVRGVALQREPYELRGSRTVLRERGGCNSPAPLTQALAVQVHFLPYRTIRNTYFGQAGKSFDFRGCRPALAHCCDSLVSLGCPRGR